MAALRERCPYCGSENVIKHGLSEKGRQRYICRNNRCSRKTFQDEYERVGCKAGINEEIVKMVKDTGKIRKVARLLNISPTKVMSTIRRQRVG